MTSFVKLSKEKVFTKQTNKNTTTTQFQYLLEILITVILSNFTDNDLP